MVRTILVTMLSLGLAASMVACGGSKEQVKQETPALTEAIGTVAPTTHGQALIINDTGYAPERMVVAPGTTVIWRNSGVGTHTATAAGLFDSGNIEPGAAWAFTFTKAGTYTYGFTVHPGVTGTIVVQ